jgi:uncharacterized protein (TIGR02145 family)
VGNYNTAYGNTVVATPATVSGTTVTSVSANISGLTPGSVYHFRIKVVSNDVTNYGEDKILNTIGLPVLTTSAITSLTYNSAISGGNISDDGGSIVSARGVCWSINHNPTLSDTKTTDGSGTGTYVSNLSGLTAATTYYVRAYATNGSGTAYGEEVSFNTVAAPFLSITLPDANSHWAGTHSYDITWNDDLAGNVIIQLLQDSTVVNDIVVSPGIASNGVYNWSIPFDINSSPNYRIKISSTDDSEIYGLSNYFEIVKPVQDNDGNTYDIVRIGEQWWTAENLKTRFLNDGTLIPSITDAGLWAARTSPAHCWYNNSESTYKNTYGALYNWFTVSTGKLCPTNWHVPSWDDWIELENYLIENGYNFDGTFSGNKIAKAMASTSNWTFYGDLGVPGNTDYPEYRNKSGFNGQPGGYRDESGTFSTLGTYGRWWSSVESSTSEARYLYISNILYYTSHGEGSKKRGFSVRCVKD